MHPTTTTIRVTHIDNDCPGNDNPLYADDEATREAWLPTLGPTAIVLARWMASHAGTHSTNDIAGQLGVGVARLHHALHRLDRHGLVIIHDGDPITVYAMRRWPEPKRRST
jgi:hypothetical protein